MIITNFQGNQTNSVNGIVREYSLEELSQLFSHPRKGPKHFGYFVRGELNPTARRDANLSAASVLVLDGDRTSKDENSCCPPIDVHIALKELNINHIIYTTHSHSFNKNKFRVVIPCKIRGKQELKNTVDKLLGELLEKQVDIYPVKEMYTWSQPWFIPSRDDPDDGVFEFYNYIDGDDYNEVIMRDNPDSVYGSDSSGSNMDSGKDSVQGDTESSVSESITDIIGTIIGGDTGLHQAINKYAYMQIKDGIAPKVVCETLRGLMMANQNHDSRWQDRYNEIDRSVEGAKQRVNYESDDSVDVSDIEYDVKQFEGEMPWPPGLMGQLAHDAYEMQLYQYKEVAIVSAIGLVAGIAGRKFNVSRTGLNVYLTLIMETGMGKDSIGKFITHSLFSAMNDGEGNLITPSFLGKAKYTGSKAVVNSMKNALSQISVFTEAGLLMQTQSGDQSGLLRALLDIYTKSGNDDIFIGAEYSDSDKSVPSLRSPALSIINESTADSLQQAFRDNNSIDSGHLPRQSIYRIVGDKPYRNWDAKLGLSADCMTKLQELVTTCGKVQSAPTPNAWNFKLDSDVAHRAQEIENYYTDQYNQYRGHNNNKANMATRMPLKALKFAAIASVFNHKDLEIRMPEWEWAEQMVMYEYEGVDHFFMSSGNGDMEDLITMHVGPCILRMLQGKIKNRKGGLDALDRKSGTFPLSKVKFNLKNNTALAKHDDDTKFRSQPVTGLEKVIRYMERIGYIKSMMNENLQLEKTKLRTYKRHNVYQITEEFKQLMSK